MPNSKRLLILFLLGLALGASVLTQGSVVTQGLTVSSPLVNDAGTIKCPTCVVGPSTEVVGGIIGGHFDVAGTQFRALWANVSTAAFDPDTPVPVGGWIRNHTVFSPTAAGDSARSVLFPVVGPAASGAPSVPAFLPHGGFTILQGSAAGAYSDPLTTVFVRVEPGAYYNFAHTAYFSNQPTMRGWTAEFVTDSNTGVIGATADVTNIALSSTAFRPFFSQAAADIVATEVQAQWTAPVAYTARNLMVVTNVVQSATGNCVIRLRSQSADTALTLTVPASGPIGLYANLTSTAAIAANDLLDLAQTNNATAASCGLRSFSLELVPSVAGDFFIGGFGGVNADATPRFSPLFSRGAGGSTETDATTAIARAGTIDNCAVVHSVDSGAETITVTLRRNLAASSISGSYGSSSGPGRKPLTGSQAVNKGDRLSFSYVATAGTLADFAGTSCRFR